MAKQIFVNLPVKDLKKAIDFFTKLGFTFNPEFTDQNATCMIIGENIFAMLLVEKFFKTFIQKEICDAKKSTEVLLALSVESRTKVDELMTWAINAGGREPRAPQDYGWMYGRAFEDLDGHIWEVFFMDETSKPKR
ncbi:VOC family protein [Candidatus Woesearchaeota archaeon]|nr:VOC family protein [Candidatus Woesearchaeota archaeon]